MFNLITASTLLLAAVSSVSGLAIVRRSAPAGYAEGYLEPYATYHTRYIALSCQTQHKTAFFEQCCHPLLASENLSTARPAQCSPSFSASTSASAAQPTSTVTTPADGEPDCDGSGDDDSSSAAPQATATPASSQAATPSSPDAQATVTPEAATSSSSTVPTSSESAPATSATPDPPTNDASGNVTPANNDNNSNSDLVSGGFATFFFQGGNPGACGTVHQDSDLIAAMDQDRFGNGGNGSPLCGKQVQINNPANGKSVVVTVADDCPTCVNSNSIDLSQGAFDRIADESQGTMPIEWKFL